MEAQNVPVVICFNKTDLGKEGEAERLAGIYRDAGYDVHLSCALAGEGIEAIHDLLRGKDNGTCARPVLEIILTNRTRAEMETGAVSEKSPQGRHDHKTFGAVCREGDLVMDDAGLQLHLCRQYEAGRVKGFLSGI